MFDYRHKDLETGKLNIDKLTTLNGNTCLSDWIEPGKEPSYEYCVRVEHEKYMSSLRKEQRDEARKHHYQKEQEKRERENQTEKDRIRLVASEKIRLEQLEREMQEREDKRQKELVQIEEYRVRLQIREEELIKEKQRNLAERMGYSGQRIITSKWNVR